MSHVFHMQPQGIIEKQTYLKVLRLPAFIMSGISGEENNSYPLSSVL